MLPERQDLNRRDWMTQVLQALSGSAIAAQLCGQEHTHPSGPLETAGPWQPAFLTNEQNEALISLGECLVPGSAAVHCNRVIDLILSIESEPAQRTTVAALAAFDTEARNRFHNSFCKLHPDQQNEILIGISSSHDRLANPFGVIKEWVADAYWSSQEGLRELGWKGRVAWSSFDGCPHAGDHS